MPIATIIALLTSLPSIIQAGSSALTAFRSLQAASTALLDNPPANATPAELQALAAAAATATAFLAQLEADAA